MHNTNSMTMRSRSQSPHHDDSTRHKSKGDWRRKIVLKISFPRSNIVTLWISFVTLFLLPHTVQCSGFDKEGVYVIDGIWIDDFAQDSTRYGGWQIKNGDTGDLGNPYIDEAPKAPLIFHGIFTKINSNTASGYNTMYRYFSCLRGAMVYVSFDYAFCDYADGDMRYGSHYIQVGLNHDVSQEYDMEGGTPLTSLEPDLSFVNNLEGNIVKCDDLTKWDYKTVSNYLAGSVEKRTQFLIIIQSLVTSYNDFHVLFNLEIECVALPTTEPTPEPSAPSTEPTTDPTMIPSVDPTSGPSASPSASPTLTPSTAPTQSPTKCVDYTSSSFVTYNSNDGHGNVSTVNISPQVQESFDLDADASVLYYNDPPTADLNVPYINAWIGCDISNDEVCFIDCIGTASCLLANIVPSSAFTERVLIRCNHKFSCKSMTLNYSQSLSANLNTITIECSALLACNDYVLNLISDVDHANATELYVTLYCMTTLSCQATTINVRQPFSSEIEVYINVYCVQENSCKELAILNEHNENINIYLSSFEYSEGIQIKTSGAGYDLVHIQCGNDKDLRYLRYDTSDLLNDDELLNKAREEYTARRLPCEDIEITCSNIIDHQEYTMQCSMRYSLSDMVDVTQIIQSDRNCFWIDINRLYVPQCYGSCGQNITIYQHMMNVELEMIMGVSKDDRDTSISNIDTIVCEEYFGDVNVTIQTLSNIDAIVTAALRLYKDKEIIHDTGNDVYSQIINGSTECEEFDMETDVILINSTFSVQSISSNRDEVSALFGQGSLFHEEVNNLFREYYGEGIVPVFVVKADNFTLSPSTDPTPGPTQSPLDCPYNTFQIEHGSQDRTTICFDCEEDDIGYECQGGLFVNVEYSYWVSSHGDNESSTSSLHSITNNDSIISLQCPMGQCCVEHDGCDYFNDSVDPRSQLLCAENRNVSSITCSRCNDGYNEVLGTFRCGKCKRTDYAFVSLLFSCALVFTLFLIFVMSRPNALRTNIKQKEIDWRKLLLYDQKNLVIILTSKICMYYYQGLNQILSSRNISPTSVFQKTLLTLFDFDISLFSSGNENGICFIGGIDSGIYKLLTSYIWYIFVVLNVLIIALLSRARSYLCGGRMACACIPYIKIACINIILMTAGPLLATSFKVLTCIEYIDGKYYHFFDSEIACYGPIWWLAGVLPITILCGTLMIFWYIVYKQSAQQRENESNPYRTFTKRFTYNMWYWEFVLFIRRFGIAALTSFYGIAYTFSSVVLTSFIVLLLALQTKFN
eukprot:896748_1